MLTDQNYDANVASQSLSNSTAENATQTAQNDNGQQANEGNDEPFIDEYFLEIAHSRGASEYVRSVLTELFDFYGSFDPTPTILEMAENWLVRRDSLSQAQIIKVQQILHICKTLTELRTYMECLSSETSDFESEGPTA